MTQEGGGGTGLRTEGKTEGVAAGRTDARSQRRNDGGTVKWVVGGRRRALYIPY